MIPEAFVSELDVVEAIARISHGQSPARFAEISDVLLSVVRERDALRAKVADLEFATSERLAETLHELKAPLHAASGFVDLVAGGHVGPLNDQQKDFLETARAECRRIKHALATLVDDAASNAERRLCPARIEPRELILASVGRVRGQAAATNVDVIGRVENGAEPVAAEREAVLQVIGNLLQNALRMAPADSEIVVNATPDGPGWTRFEVADRGPGILVDELGSIFDKFAQGSERPRQPGEVGLGLAIARRIVEQHHGRIWAENRLGGGARFCFTLPAAT